MNTTTSRWAATLLQVYYSKIRNRKVNGGAVKDHLDIVDYVVLVLSMCNMVAYASVSVMLIDEEDDSANVFASNNDVLVLHYSPAFDTSVQLFITFFDSQFLGQATSRL